VDPGFEPSRLLGFQVNAPRAQYGDQESIRAFYRTLLDEIEALPGVTSAAASWQTPLQSGMSDWPVRTSAEGAEWVGADPNMVTDSYFETLGIALVEGRLFEPSDLARPEGTVIVSETAARGLFPDGSAVGRLVNVNFDTPVWREIVGVVRDVRGRGLGSEPGPQTYFTLSDLPFAPNPALIVTLRTGAGPEQIGAAVTGIMRSLDPDVPVGPVVSMDEQVGASMASERFLATLLATFAGTALLLGALGVYGLLAYDVSQGRREIGLRMALGARPGAILGAVVGGALVLGVAGTLLGMAGALATGRLLESFLYGVSSTDPATVAAVVVVVLSTALIASVEPARRAAAVDPLSALREG
jgi:predicted permease